MPEPKKEPQVLTPEEYARTKLAINAMLSRHSNKHVQDYDTAYLTLIPMTAGFLTGLGMEDKAYTGKMLREIYELAVKHVGYMCGLNEEEGNASG